MAHQKLDKPQDAGNHDQRKIALFGSDRAFADTPRGMMVGTLLSLRAHRSWITPYCYGWLRYSDDIRSTQQRLADYRKARGEQA